MKVFCLRKMGLQKKAVSRHGKRDKRKLLAAGTQGLVYQKLWK